LLHNGALAKLALGRVVEAKAEMVHVLELAARHRARPAREALREFVTRGQGRHRGRDDLFHREALKEIRVPTRPRPRPNCALLRPESQKRRIELLGRDNQLKSAELENQTLTRRL
jgi:hypothetical protein